MIKKDLVNEVWKMQQRIMPYGFVESVVSDVFTVIERELMRGGKVELLNFGKFEVRERAEREGTNPRTGEKITLPRKKIPFFKAGKGFKAKVNR